VTVTTTLRTALGDREVEVLERAVEGDQPSLHRLLDKPLDEVAADDLNKLREAVSVLLMRGGFRANWETHTHGQECEDLIDRLAPWHWGKDD
jgi:hypothetical protein